MPRIIHPSHLPDIAASSVELLEATGYNDLALLLTLDPGDLHREILKANQMLQLAHEDVSFEEVVGWIYHASYLLGKPIPATIADLVVVTDGSSDEGVALEHADSGSADETELATESVSPNEEGPSPVNYEHSPEVQAMLGGSPYALPLPARLLQDSKVSVSQIPAGIMLNCYVGDLDVRVNQSAPQAPAGGRGGYSTQIVGGQDGPGIDVSRVRSAGGPEPAVHHDESHHAPPEESRMSLIRSPRSETNKGRNPQSHWFIRGVLHSHPVSTYLGALVTLCITVLMPAAVIAAALLIFSREMPDNFQWVPEWFLWIPLALFINGLAYLIWGMGGRCRVCNQKLFVHRSHLKNSKAHRIPGIGHVIPLCLHILIFRWFRCTHCGTPIRLKE